jgi:hypothetical protein
VNPEMVAATLVGDDNENDEFIGELLTNEI